MLPGPCGGSIPGSTDRMARSCVTGETVTTSTSNGDGGRAAAAAGAGPCDCDDGTLVRTDTAAGATGGATAPAELATARFARYTPSHFAWYSRTVSRLPALGLGTRSIHVRSRNASG